jgi:hypothetical protein
MSTDRAIACDQAIFTSIRSPMGEGYRVIAATTGVSPDERAEITVKSPSHESLCESASEPVGLSTFLLGSGRRCVAYCCHAGQEHTARGGQRVYTHMVLLDQAAYRQFNSNPVRVHAALGSVITREGPLLKPPQRLERLTLTLPRCGSASCKLGPLPSAAPAAAEWLWGASAELLAEQCLILTGEPQDMAMLEWAVLTLPRCLRERLNASVELKFSPSRGMHLVLMKGADPLLPRQAAGQAIHLYQTSDVPQPPTAAIEPWHKVLRRWWKQGRFVDIVQLTSLTCADAEVDSLARIAGLCEDADSLATGDVETIERIAARYVSLTGQTPAEQSLIERIRDAAERKRSQLAQLSSC